MSESKEKYIPVRKQERCKNDCKNCYKKGSSENVIHVREIIHK